MQNILQAETDKFTSIKKLTSGEHVTRLCIFANMIAGSAYKSIFQKNIEIIYF